jgi:hypothetical protein
MATSARFRARIFLLIIAGCFAPPQHSSAQVPPDPARKPAAKAAAKPAAKPAARNDVSAFVRRMCDAYVGASRREYQAGRFQKHAELSAGFAIRLRRIPLSQLEPCETALIRAIQHDGVDAYTTVLVDHAYRLARAASKNNGRRYLALAWAVRAKMAAANPSSSSTTLIRVSNRGGYRPYSSNVGFSVLAVSYGQFGRSQFARGGAPESLVRFIDMYRTCKDDAARPASASLLKTEQRLRCNALMGEMDKAHPGGGAGPSMPALADNLKGGITRGVAACLAAEDKAATMISQFEQYTECRVDEKARQASRTSFSPGGLMDGGASASPPHTGGSKGLQDALKGTKLIKETHTSGEDAQGYKWSQDDYRQRVHKGDIWRRAQRN